MKCRGKIRREKQGKDEKRKAGKRQSSDKQGKGGVKGDLKSTEDARKMPTKTMKRSQSSEK